MWAFWTSNSILSGTPLPVRPHLLILPNSSPKSFKYKGYRGFSHSDHHSHDIKFSCGLNALQIWKWWECKLRWKFKKWMKELRICWRRVYSGTSGLVSKCKGVTVALIFKSVVIKESEWNLKLYLFVCLFLLFHIRRILKNDNTSWCLLFNLSPTNKWLYSIKWGQSTYWAWFQHYYLW